MKYNKEGNIITNHKELKEEYLKNFQHRLRQCPILLELSEYKEEIEDNFKELLKSTKVNKSEKWTESELDDDLGDLKSKQSQDCNGFAYEFSVEKYRERFKEFHATFIQ